MIARNEEIKLSEAWIRCMTIVWTPKLINYCYIFSLFVLHWSWAQLWPHFPFIYYRLPTDWTCNPYGLLALWALPFKINHNRPYNPFVFVWPPHSTSKPTDRTPLETGRSAAPVLPCKKRNPTLEMLKALSGHARSCIIPHVPLVVSFHDLVFSWCWGLWNLDFRIKIMGWIHFPEFFFVLFSRGWSVYCKTSYRQLE